LRCLFGDATCSLTVATYLLCTLTLLAFLAAYYAAKTALRTYQMEQSALLSERPCVDETHVPHIVVTLDPDFGLSGEVPGDEERDLYYVAFDYDFENLGRSPIENAQVCLECTLSGSEASISLKQKYVDVGSIRRDGYVHVRVLIWYGHVTTAVRWLRDGATRLEMGKAVPLYFAPSQARRNSYLAAAPLEFHPETVAPKVAVP